MVAAVAVVAEDAVVPVAEAAVVADAAVDEAGGGEAEEAIRARFLPQLERPREDVRGSHRHRQLHPDQRRAHPHAGLSRRYI